MLGIATVSMALIPFLYLFHPGLLAIFVINLYSGISAAGGTLLLFNRLLEVVPLSQKSTAFGLVSTMTAASGVVAPMLGMYLLSVGGFNLAFGMSAILRLVGGIIFFFWATGTWRRKEVQH